MVTSFLLFQIDEIKVRREANDAGRLVALSSLIAWKDECPTPVPARWPICDGHLSRMTLVGPGPLQS